MKKLSQLAVTLLMVTLPTMTQAIPAPASTSMVIAQSRTDTKSLKRAIIAALRQPGLPQPKIQKLVTEGTYGLATWTMGKREVWSL